MKGKVFCIGFHKTGTTSLRKALETLGYRVTGPDGINDPDIANNVYQMAEQLVPEFDAFQDNPWPVLYKVMDQKFPGSKFILTQRNTDSWIKSQVNHFGRDVTPMREWIYGAGCPEGNETIYQARYEAHNREVKAYFSNRPDDFLIMDLTAGDGWQKLCPFLGEPIPGQAFPHSNSADSRARSSKRENRLSRRIKQGIRRLIG